MNLGTRIKNLETKTVKEYKGIKYDLSALTTEELKLLMIILDDDQADSEKGQELINKIKSIE